MIRIVFVHGFNVRDHGAGTVDKIAAELLRRHPKKIQVDIDQADYGWHFLFRVHLWVGRRRAIKRIHKALQLADAVVTHSNGANYSMKALKKQKRPGLQLFHFSPALNRGYNFGKRFKDVFVYHTKKDKVVWFAKFIPFSAWGDMGRNGAKDKNVVNVDLTNHVGSHSDWFTPPDLKLICDDLEKRLGLI